MNVLKLIASLVISFAAGGVGSLATIPNIPTWYAGLDKPPFLPPNEVFGPVWTTLYLLMGVALYLVWTTETKKSRERAYIAFGSQIVLNALWSLVFFGLHLPWLGVAVIAVLLATIVWTIWEFWKHNKLAAYLLVPYILWVSFASYLTLGVALLN